MNLLFAQSANSQCTLNGQAVDCAELANKAGSFLGLGIAVIAIIILLSIIAFAFWLWMLIHAIQYNSPDRTMWIAILGVSFVLGLSFIAAIIYFFAEKKKAEQADKYPSTPPESTDPPKN